MRPSASDRQHSSTHACTESALVFRALKQSVTALHSPKPSRAYSAAPRSSHIRTPGCSFFSLTSKSVSAFLPRKLALNGNGTRRRHIAWSPASISGILFVDSHSLPGGVNVTCSP
ncbi:hypothetical protein D9M72_577300 [compost metagenome]